MAPAYNLLPQANWDFYFCTLDGQPASIMLDLALRATAPQAERPHLLQIDVRINDPNAFGLTGSAEAETFFILEDRLADHLAHNLDALYVARITSSGYRRFYFYARAAVDMDRIVEEVMERFVRHHYTATAREDAAWEVYLHTCYPAPAQYQAMLNRRVLDHLAASGDNLSQAREVSHFLSFPDKGARSRFLTALTGEGFEVQKSTDDALRLVLIREERIDPTAIDGLTQRIMALAEGVGGSYDGWETAMVRG